MKKCPHSKLQFIIKTIDVIFQNSYLKHVGWLWMKEDGTLNIFINIHSWFIVAVSTIIAQTLRGWVTIIESSLHLPPTDVAPPSLYVCNANISFNVAIMTLTFASPNTHGGDIGDFQH